MELVASRGTHDAEGCTAQNFKGMLGR